MYTTAGVTGTVPNIADQQAEAQFLFDRNRYDLCDKFCEEALRQQGDGVQGVEKAKLDVLRGKCFLKRESITQAYTCFYSAITNNNTSAEAFMSLGQLFSQNSQHDESVKMYARAYEFDSTYPGLKHAYAVALSDLATIKKTQRDVSTAVDMFNKSIELDPNYAPAHYNLGVINNEQQQLDQAESHYTAALNIDPKYKEALCNLGVIAKLRDDPRKAVLYYEQALAIDPNFQIGRNNLAIVLTDIATGLIDEGRTEEAVAMYRQGLYFNPCYPDAHYNMGIALERLGQRREAMVAYELALAFRPSYAEAYNNLGVLYKEEDNVQKAITCYGRALHIKRNFTQALSNMALAHIALWNLDAALECCKKVVEADSSIPEIRNTQGLVCYEEGSLVEAVKMFDLCLELNPRAAAAHHNKLLALSALVMEPEQLCKAHADWGRAYCPAPPARPSVARPPGALLHVGYVCPDFGSGVAPPMPALGAHTPTVQVTFYLQTAVRPAWMAEGARVVSIARMPTAAVCTRMASDGVHVLVDLCGHTTPNRADVLAARPAPVQVLYTAHGSTTGLPTIDYRVTDHLTDPQEPNPPFTEKLWRLPRVAQAYTPAPPIPPRTNLRVCVSFGSTVDLSAVSEHCVAVWASVLLTVPKARLLLVSRPLATDRVCQQLKRRFQHHNVDVTRLDLFPTDDTLEGGALAHMDVFLDSFPRSSPAKVAEALSAGVPVLTLAGRYDAAPGQPVQPSSRTGGALLQSMGPGPWTSWMPAGQELFATQANAIAAIDHRAWLGQCRDEVRGAFTRSPAADPAGLARELERAYEGMWGEVHGAGAAVGPDPTPAPPVVNPLPGPVVMF